MANYVVWRREGCRLRYLPCLLNHQSWDILLSRYPSNENVANAKMTILDQSVKSANYSSAIHKADLNIDGYRFSHRPYLFIFINNTNKHQEKNEILFHL